MAPQYCPSPQSVELFQVAVGKDPATVTPDEFRALVACYGWMDESERAKFRITRAQLTEAEIENYTALGLIDIYFPAQV